MLVQKKFFSYVIPSVLALALSGIYAIVDGFFVGNSIGNAGLSAINIAYPVAALILALGTGIGMGGSVYFSIYTGAKETEKALSFIGGTLWLLLITGIATSLILSALHLNILELFGAKDELLLLGGQYLQIICLGAGIQVFATGLLPILRNTGGASIAMLVMILGFITNIILDYAFVWVYNYGMQGAAFATIIGEFVTFAGAIFFLAYKKQLTFKVKLKEIKSIFKSIVKIGIAPFGIALVPSCSLILINKFSSIYGGLEAIAVYACISYAISIIYLVLEGVGDGSQPLMSFFYGEKSYKNLYSVRKLAYMFAFALVFASMSIIFLAREQIGVIFGASASVVNEVVNVFPIFLLALPFAAINRITTASFFATEKSTFSYIVTYSEPIIMLLLMSILGSIGGQKMIWWSVVLTQITITCIALSLKIVVDNKQKLLIGAKICA